MFRPKNEKHLALIIKTSPQGESNKLVSMLLSDGRLLRGIAHGVRKPGSRFGAALESGTFSRIMFKSGVRETDLVTISEALLVNPLSQLKQTLELCKILFEYLGLIESASRLTLGDSFFFEQFHALSIQINAQPEKIKTLLPIARIYALSHAGKMPDWLVCASCRLPRPKWVSLNGAYCQRCALSFKGQTRLLSTEVADLASRIAQGSLEFENEPWDELNAILIWLLEIKAQKE